MPDENGTPEEPGNSPEVTTPQQTQPARTQAPPPAAGIVIDGTDTEEASRLRDELNAAHKKIEKAERMLKERETRISELEDQNHQLKQIPTATTKKPEATVLEW